MSAALIAPSAHAAPASTVQAAIDATVTRADIDGLDVIRIVRSSKSHLWPASTIIVGAGTKVCHHVERDTEGNSF